jgi:predicted NBD/HSP70 family sugar kinase
MITVVDVGATKTLVAQFDEAKQLINKSRFPTPEDQEVFLTELKRSLNQLTDITMISMAIPGIVVDGVATTCPNLPLWKNVPVRTELQKTYKCPVVVENDANLAGLAEINSLSPVPQVGLYITLSTGIGTGLIVEGRLAPAFSLSELGHMVFQFNGVWQEWEDFASGQALVNHFGKKANELKRAEEWQWTAEGIAAGLCAVIPAIRPEVIVFGGSLGGHLHQFVKPVEKLLEQRLTRSRFYTLPRLVQAQHPDDAVLFGCYYYAAHNKDSR